MPSKSFFTLPAESILKKKYGREALLGLATRYHGDNAMTVSHPSHKFSFEDRPPPYCKAKNCTKKKALIYLIFPLICYFHGHVSFTNSVVYPYSRNKKNIPRYWNGMIVLIRLNCNCSIDNPFVSRIILQRK